MSVEAGAPVPVAGLERAAAVRTRGPAGGHDVAGPVDEADDLLHGRKVMRFWRGDGTRGIDVTRVFLDPHEFDLLYWIQGSAAAPFLREGEFTTPGTWARLEAALDHRMLRYSFWFN